MDKIFADFGIGEVGNKSGEGVGLGIGDLDSAFESLAAPGVVVGDFK